MPGFDEERVALTGDELECLRDVLAAHGVGLAVLFGFTVQPDADPADLDIAIEFSEYRPTDEGYAAVYLDLYSTLEDEIERPVDLVDVHSTSPPFASVVFDDGVLVLGSEERLETLERRLTGDEPSVENARKRVTAAASRLREGFS
ncbi:nucleotidyltransferase domain-containing protein [Halobacteria archaeon HArc-gm2]|nr:nucleotidyltransferase domain-containing protein [Halobacteria archaeon HArc-gm2]